MPLFRKSPSRPQRSYDPSLQKPMIRCSICTGEQVAGFRRLDTGAFEEVMLLRGPEDLRNFRELYGITAEIEKFY